MSGMDPSMQSGRKQTVDAVSKNIQDQIMGKQQEMQKLTADKGMDVDQRMEKRRELSQEIANLNSQLRQRQAEMRREQHQKLVSPDNETKTGAESDVPAGTDAAGAGQEPFSAAGTDSSLRTKEDERQADNGTKTGSGPDGQEETSTKADAAPREDIPSNGRGTSPSLMDADSERAMISAEDSVQQAQAQRHVVSQLERKLAVVSSEIEQYHRQGISAGAREAEAAELEERVDRASTAQSQILDGTQSKIRLAMDEESEIGRKEAEKREMQRKVEKYRMKPYQSVDIVF